MKIDYLKKADIILKSNFWVAGYGHFDLTKKDIAELLELLDNHNSKNTVKKLYERLEKQRMG